MNWKTLLNPVRVRELMGGSPSKAAAGELRTQFDRDYDRSAFSTPVRRLQDKAQVFPREPNDSVRTRLTHSLEVSTLARSLGRRTENTLIRTGRLDEQNSGAIESIAATCGLIHDLGNPPFGHAGEKAISDWFFDRLASNEKSVVEFFRSLDGQDTQSSCDFLHFEGNAQTIRIVARLQVMADRFGLNLTAGTMSAALKYTAPSHRLSPKANNIHERTKPGYFKSENDLIDRIREVTGTGISRNPITFLVEACDDIVYALVDIEDGVKKKVVSWDQVRQALTDGIPKDVIDPCIAYAADILDGDASLLPMNRDEIWAQAFRIAAIAALVPSVSREFEDHYQAIMQGEYHGELVDNCAMAPIVNVCKGIAAKHVYTSRYILERELAGRRIIHDLMDLFWEATRAYEGVPLATKSFAGKLYFLMSENYRVVFEDQFRSGCNPDYCRMQLVTDYICGMTDSYACELHRTLQNV